MNHSGAIRKHKQIDDYACDGSGPRPPVPGEESRFSKMTESGGCADRSPTMASSTASSSAGRPNLNWERMAAWKKGLEHMLCDTTAVELLKKFVETEAGLDNKNIHYLNFYFLCEGLPEHTDEKKIRKIFAKCYEKFKNVIPGIHKVAQMTDKSVPAYLSVFKELQQNVVVDMSKNIYPAFFQSRTFIDYYERFHRGELATAPICTELNRNASLATVHEDTELQPPKLTEQLLMLTERARFNVGIGAHGYNIPFHTSYNPVTRQNSDKMSCSSGHTKSDQQSLTKFKDSQHQSHRKQQRSCDSLDRLKHNYEINVLPATDVDRYMHQLPGTMNDKVPRRMEGPMKSYQVDYNQLFSKLAVLKEQKETDDIMRHKLETISKNQERSKDPTHHMPNQKHSLDDPMFMEKLSALQDNDQDILDQHVSRVFSPQFSPMVPSSPGQPLPRRQLPLPPIDYSSRPAPSMKSSKSMPLEQKTSRRNSNVYGCLTDSGVSEMSYDTAKFRREDEDAKQKRRHSSHSNTRLLPQITEQNAITTVYTYFDDKLDEPYKTKIGTARPTLRNYKDLMPRRGAQFKRFFFKTVEENSDNAINEELFNDNDILPLFDGKVMCFATSNALQSTHELGNDYTVALYAYANETVYRTKIPGRNISLRQFIDYLPKAGNFRFFFKTVCEEIDGPIHEEIINDLDILPLFEGIIMGKVDSE